LKFGVVTFPTEYSISPPELGRALEHLRYESLWFPEHTHIPASRESPWPGGAELPREYSHTLDPFVALGAVSAVTSRLGLGFGVCLVVERDPILTAKEVAALDVMSGGRVIFGVGFGWNREELENHGTRWEDRFRVGRERVEAMKAIWTQDEASYAGASVSFDRIWSWPKPLQTPHPPVIVGGAGERTLQRVVRYGDGWMPIAARLKRPLEDWLAELRRLAEAAGRHPDIPVTIYGARPDPAEVERMIGLGVDRLLFNLPSLGRDEALPRVERWAELVDRYSG
jgi:probable F420-dependent oxidoreductase